MTQSTNAAVAGPVRALSGPEKASIVMLTMGEERSAKLLPKLSEDELGRLTQAMAKIGKIGAAQVESLLDEFGKRTAPAPAPTETAPPAHSPGANPRSTLGIWDKIARVSPEVLAGYLRHEHPQAVAVVMRKLPPQAAARVLDRLPEAFAGEVVARVVSADPVRREVLAHLEETLQEELGADLDQHGMASGPAHLKRIMAHLEQPVGQRFVKAVQATDAAALPLVKAKALTFDDLATLDSRGVGKLLDDVGPATVAAALKGADDRLREFIIGQMPPRAAKVLAQEIEATGFIRLREVDEAQETILERAKALAARGEITLQARPTVRSGN